MELDKEIKLLLNERAGYVQRKLSARVKACDDALSALGYKEKETATMEAPTERASKPVASKRTR